MTKDGKKVKKTLGRPSFHLIFRRSATYIKVEEGQEEYNDARSLSLDFDGYASGNEFFGRECQPQIKDQ